MHRRNFLLSLVALPSLVSASTLKGAASTPELLKPLRLKKGEGLNFVIQDFIEHPLYWWPRTLLSYPFEYASDIDLSTLVLTSIKTGQTVPVQFSEITASKSGISHAKLNFFCELASGSKQEFILNTSSNRSAYTSEVSETVEDNTIILDSGLMRVRIPASQKIQSIVPGPIMQVSRGQKWFGESSLSFKDDHVSEITTKRVASGPLFISYQVTYTTEKNALYSATITCKAGMEFVHFEENMEGLPKGTQGILTTNWSNFEATHRQAPNHPFPLSDTIQSYEDYAWEKIDSTFVFDRNPSPDGKFPFTLGTYERAPANFHSGTFANFWNEKTDDALGVFIDDVNGWQDHQYTYEVESTLLQVRYFAKSDNFYWEWPLASGTRSTCITCYDHAKDRQAMKDLESKVTVFATTKAASRLTIPLTFTSHTLFLQNRYGSINLNRIKDWVLHYPETGRPPMKEISNGREQDPDQFVDRIMNSSYVCTLPLTGTRQMAGHGPIPGRSIINFSPVPSRQIRGWVEGYSSCAANLSAHQKSRITAIFLLLAYIHADDEFMPLVNMLAGHPNFLADVKAVSPSIAFLFPDHPLAPTWADMWEKCLEVNTRFNTRPEVKTWDARGGRWTENLGTYVWAFIGPTSRTDYLLKCYDNNERMLSPELAQMTEWLVNVLSAPFNGESEKAYKNLMQVDYGREWGVVAPGKGPRRVDPPQGAHSEQRISPRSMWYLAYCLRNYAPMASEYGMWASSPFDNDAESKEFRKSTWYPSKDNRGTNPHLKSSKFTGYGIVLRSGVETKEEISVHLQQIDEGPNYRWGRAGEGGNGMIYFYAGGKSYSYTAPEDVGDRDDQDTDFCTTFGIYREGHFRTIGMNGLTRPMYNLGTGQYAELVPRQGTNAYASPEYISRSVLLAGNQYFILYDSVSDQSLVHRLSWFVRKGDSLPNIQLLLGASGNRETQKTEINTVSSTGVWFDGIGDSLAVISHRKDIQSESTNFGCRVTLPGIEDLVFRKPHTVHFKENNLIFSGTAGLIRTEGTRIEFSLFHGTRIAVRGLLFETNDEDLGIGGRIQNGKEPTGKFYAYKPSELTLTTQGLAQGTHLFVDGISHGEITEKSSLTVQLKQGEHSWELSTTLPTPCAPSIIRTENYTGGARIIGAPVASATHYRLELSLDNGVTWSKVKTQANPVFTIEGLKNETKVHVRFTALNEVHESLPGAEYPLYVSDKPPQTPDGLRLKLKKGQAKLSWGEILGASEYRLYGRTCPDKEFKLLYKGIECSLTDNREIIEASNAKPSNTPVNPKAGVIEYCVTAVNDNGESKRSRIANTDPASWRNWDPSPGERFRRLTNVSEDYMHPNTDAPKYYPI